MRVLRSNSGVRVYLPFSILFHVPEDVRYALWAKAKDITASHSGNVFLISGALWERLRDRLYQSSARALPLFSCN